MDPDDFVFLIHAKDKIQAQVLASLLEAEGIETFVPGANLLDEFASASQRMGGLGMSIHVPAGRLDDALQLLAEAREVGGGLVDDEDPEEVADTETDP
jgi:hypothetical protein